MKRFKDGVVQLHAGESLIQAYRNTLDIIYDNKLPLTKVIGFYVEDNFSANSKSLDRNKSVMENMIQLSSNLSKVVFVPFRDMIEKDSNKFTLIKLRARRGEIVTTKTKDAFKRNTSAVQPITESQHILSALNDVSLTMIVIDYAGYVSMESAASLIEQAVSGFEREGSSFFPMNTDFSLIDYVKILPPQNGRISYRLENGMTDETLNLYWERGAKYNAAI